jgi:hypothetical protein
LIPVKPGDKLVGRISLVGQSGRLFNYTCEFVGIPGTFLTAENLPQLTDCTETLEVYGLLHQSDYPATTLTSFLDVTLKLDGSAVSTIAWTARGNSPPEIVDASGQSGRIDIKYT